MIRNACYDIMVNANDISTVAGKRPEAECTDERQGTAGNNLIVIV